MECSLGYILEIGFKSSLITKGYFVRIAGEIVDFDLMQKKPIVDKINKLKEQILSLRNTIKKESQFNAKVRLNMQIKQLAKQIDE